MQRHERLRRRTDFERLWAKGKRYSHHWLRLMVLPNGLAHNRYGFVASRRVGKAVVRNRLRRQLREMIRAIQADLQAGYDVVIVAQPALVGQPSAAIRRIIRKLALEAGLLNGESD